MDDVGSRIFFRIDSALRREPTCVRSGAITCPWPSSLGHARQPAAWTIALGSVLPPAKAAPAPPALPPPDGAALSAGMSDAVTSTVPPCASRNAITAQICWGESCFVITGMIGWYPLTTYATGGSSSSKSDCLQLVPG